jgi:hypothetical protein
LGQGSWRIRSGRARPSPHSLRAAAGTAWAGSYTWATTPVPQVSQVLGRPLRMLNCMGPAQQPKRFTPLLTPGAEERPWSDSILPMAARTCQVRPWHSEAASA